MSDGGHGTTGAEEESVQNTEGQEDGTAANTAPIHPSEFRHTVDQPHRSNTTPSRPTSRGDDLVPGTRSRRVTISAGPVGFDLAASRSRSRNSNGTSRDNRKLRDILEGAQAGGTSIPRRSMTSQRGIRQRSSTIRGRPRAATIFRRPSLAYAIGANPDAQSANFSLAGPQEVLPAHQPYVEPGYTDLNPAYEQPANARPVWGLAKPLPRVIRPGMVPTVDELRSSTQEANENAIQDTKDVDLEKGKVEPTLNLGKISSQLQASRELRENRFIQRRASSVSENYMPKVDNRPLSPHDEALEEDADTEADEEAEGAQSVPGLSLEHPQFSFDQGEHASDGARQDLHEPSDEDAATEDEKQVDDGWLTDALLTTNDHGVGEEIHNHHTHWSVIRTRYREPFAEFVAVLVQLTLGFCSDLTVVTSGGKAGNEETTDWAWGLSTMVGIYIAGGISGAHLNPAISIMLCIYRGFPLRKVPSYIFAQLLAAFAAGLISYGLFRKDIIEFGGVDLGIGGTMNAFITNPRHQWIDHSTAFFTEFTATAFLAIAVLALGDDTNAPPGAGMNAFILGLVITVLSMAFGYNTGAAMNPSRDLGPRLALLAVGYGGGIFRNGWWIYGPWVATISGALVGAFVYDVAIFVGGESPINYPRRRFKRAGHKWKQRTIAKIRRSKRKT